MRCHAMYGRCKDALAPDACLTLTSTIFRISCSWFSGVILAIPDLQHALNWARLRAGLESSGGHW